jgi:hypothetical protein
MRLLLDILTGVAITLAVAGAAATWVLLATGLWLIVVWDLASWLRTRFRLTRAG